MTRDRSLSTTASKAFVTAGAALLLLASTAHAGLSCSSPSGSARVGDRVSLSLSDNGWWPRVKDVGSMTATFYCSSGEREIQSMGASQGQSFTIPSSFYGACPNNQIFVKFSGTLWDVLRLANILPYSQSCGSMTIDAAPAPPTTNPQPPVVTNDPEPPTQPTNPPVEPPVSNPPTQQPTQEPPRPPSITATNAPLPITQTTAIETLIPTVISGTTILVPTTMIVTVSPTVAPVPSSTVGSEAFDPNATLPPGLPPSANNNGNQNNKSTGNNESHIPIAALASVAGIAALALIVFGLVMTRKRQRIRRERAAAAAAAAEEEGGPGVGGVYGTKSTVPEISMPSLIHTPYDFATSPTAPLPPAPIAPGSSGAYIGGGNGSRESLPDSLLEAAAAAGAGSAAVAHAAAHRRESDQSMAGFLTGGAHAGNGGGAKTELDDDVAAFPVPSLAHPTLVEEFERANHQRFSIASQESTNVMAFPMPPITSPGHGSVPGSDNGSVITLTHVPLPPTRNHDEPPYLETTSASQGYTTVAMPEDPASSPSAANMQVPPSPASMFRTTHSNHSSSAYVSATDGTDSPRLSLVSADSHSETLQPSALGDWRQSGRPESAHIRNLIRNVLEDDD